MVMGSPARANERGQVLVLAALLAAVLVAFAGIAIDSARWIAQDTYLQHAADAGALAGCRALRDGALDNGAALAAREIATANLTNSPTDAVANVAADAARVYADGHPGDPAHLESGVVVSGNTVRVAISADVQTLFARIVGVGSVRAVGRARCDLRGIGMPIVARRYANAPGPGGGFVDHMATAATSGDGTVDPANVMGFAGRVPASELAPGPVFSLYGPDSKASNDSAFRGFVALDIRNFASVTSRVYYNGVSPGTNANVIKNSQGAYIVGGYPGPAFPPVVTPADPNDQVAVMRGNDSAMVVGNFGHVHTVGDRILVGIYDGTVMEIPDFSITPPASFEVPSSGTVADGPWFSVSRNREFNSTVTLSLHGDAAAADASPARPAYVLLTDPPTSGPPTAGRMNMPVFSPNTFIPEQRGSAVEATNIQTNNIPAGIYTVWLQGDSGNPYFQTRRYPVAVRVGGATRDFSLANSTVLGHSAQTNGTINLPIYVSTAAGGTPAWGGTGTNVSLSVDADSLPPGMGVGQVTFSASSVRPSASGSGALSTLSINTSGLSAGFYTFNLRATGTNGAGQPVTHIQPIEFTVATQTGEGIYVDIIGFVVLRVAGITANSIEAQAVSGVYADPNHPDLRRAQVPRLVAWE